MEPEDHPFHPDEVDAQIDRSPDQEMLQSLHALYSAEAREMDRALARGRARLAQSQAAFAAQQEPNPARHLSLVPPERQTLTEPPPRPPQRYRRWSLRLGSLVAAALLFTLVGVLLVGLVLVRHNPTATTKLKATPTAQARATATKTPAHTNLYFISVSDGSITKFDTVTRTILWTYQWRKLTDGGAGFGGLIFGDSSVYFSAGEASPGSTEVDESLYALDAQTGLLRWHEPGPTRVAYPALASTGVVYVNSYMTNGDAELYALNASDGSVRWHVPVGPVSVETLVLANGLLYGTSFEDSASNQWSSSLFVVNPANGALLSESPLPGNRSYKVSAVVNGTLYLTSVEQKYKTAGALGASGPLVVSKPLDDGKPKISYVYAYSQDGKQLWQSQKFEGYLSGLTVVDGVVYFADGTGITTLSAKDGKLLWRYQVAQGVVMYGSPIIANGVVYLESGPLDSGNSIDTSLIALNAHDGTVRWKQKFDAKLTWNVGMCVLANGLLYLVASDLGMPPSSNLEAFSPADGSLVWKMSLSGDFNFQITAAP